MKKLISFVAAMIILVSNLVMPVQAKTFTDVSFGDWFYAPVTRAVAQGYMSGTSDTTFEPYQPMTRAMAVQVLYKISGETSDYKPHFHDVPQNKWYAKAITWAKDKGVAQGTDLNNFSPDQIMTREQLACFFSRYADVYDLKLSTKVATDYSDKTRISSWAVDAVERMNNSAIITTRSNNKFLPKGTVARSELAAALLRITGDYENGVYDSSVHVDAVYVTAAKATLTKGQKFTVEAGIWPPNAADKNLSYDTTDVSVATVTDKGVVTAVGEGKATITVTSRDDGHTETCVITVKPDEKEVQLSGGYGIEYTSKNTNELEPVYTGRKIDPNKPMVAITYDDGPRPASTNRILNCLEQYGVVATFFELGQLVDAYPQCVRREVEIGCEVGNHSYSHPNLTSLSAGGVSGQISSTNNAIYNAAGIRPSVMRPPYGSHNATVRNNVGMPLILWSIDTLDWKYRDASYVTSVIKNQVTDGSVILMHSIYDSTAAATEIIVPWLLNQGYQLVTISEMAQAKGINMYSGGTYSAFYG